MSDLNFVQVASKTQVGSGNATLAFGSNTTGSSLLLAMVIATGTIGGAFTVTDSLGNTWVPYGVNYNAAGNVGAIYAVPANVLAGGADTITVAYSLTHTVIQILLLEYTNQAAANPIDAVGAWVSNSSGATATFGPVTSTQTNEQILAVASMGNNLSLTAGAGYTMRNSGTQYLGAEDGLQATAGPYSPSWTNSTAQASIGVAIAIKSTSSAPPGNAYDPTKPFIGSVRVLGSAPAGEANEFIGTMRVITSAPVGEANPYLGSVTLGTPSSGDSNPALGQVVVVSSVPVGETDEYLGQVEES
jgi:hypothetical protein